MGNNRRINSNNKFINNHGVALITVIILSAAMLLISVTVYFTLLKGTRISGEGVRYTSIKGAAAGGIDLAIDLIDYAMVEPDEINNPVKGGVYSAECGKSFTSLIEYISEVLPIDCTVTFKNKRDNYEITTIIREEYFGPLAGAGGAPAFPPTKSNIPKFEYKFRIESTAVDSITRARVTTETLYKALVY